MPGEVTYPEERGFEFDGSNQLPRGQVLCARELDPGVGEVIQSVIEKGYRDFIGKVAEAREMPVAGVDEVARGRVWSGAQAMDRGLVDELGGLQQAIVDLGRAVSSRGLHAKRSGLPRDLADRPADEDPHPADLQPLGVGRPVHGLVERDVDRGRRSVRRGDRHHAIAARQLSSSRSTRALYSASSGPS